MADDDLDDFDIKILSLLSENGRMSWSELAERIGLSQTPTLRRVRALEAGGYITGYAASIDERRFGGRISVFVFVTLERQTDAALETFEASVGSMPNVMSCFMMTGSTDYLLRVIVPSLEEYQSFISILTRAPGVIRVTSSLAIKAVLQRPAPPLPPLSRR